MGLYSRLNRAIAGIAAACLLVGCSVSVGPYAGLCQKDDEIAPAERAAVQAAASDFLLKLTGGQAAQAYAAMSGPARAELTEASIETLARQLHVDDGYADLRPFRTYVLTVTNGSNTINRAPCGDLSDPAQWDTLATTGTGRHAFAQINGDADHDEWVFTIWLRQEGEVWKVSGITRSFSKVAGHDFQEIWMRAKQARAAHHHFAEAMLYGIADNLISRGPYLQSGLQQGYLEDRGPLPVASILSPPFPKTLRFGSQAFDVVSAQFVAFEKGKIGLVIYWRPKTWTDDAGADRMNHELIDAFRVANPDWSEAADLVAVRAYKPGTTSGWGTVYEKGSGYQPPKP